VGDKNRHKRQVTAAPQQKLTLVVAQPYASSGLAAILLDKKGEILHHNPVIHLDSFDLLTTTNTVYKYSYSLQFITFLIYKLPRSINQQAHYILSFKTNIFGPKN